MWWFLFWKEGSWKLPCRKYSKWRVQLFKAHLILHPADSTMASAVSGLLPDTQGVQFTARPALRTRENMSPLRSNASSRAGRVSSIGQCRLWYTTVKPAMNNSFLGLPNVSCWKWDFHWWRVIVYFGTLIHYFQIWFIGEMIMHVNLCLMVEACSLV